MEYEGAVDEPPAHLLTDPRAARSTPVDRLWVRLIDVDRALEARRYAGTLDLVLDIEDAFCPWNTGRYRLPNSERPSSAAPRSRPSPGPVSSRSCEPEPCPGRRRRSARTGSRSTREAGRSRPTDDSGWGSA
ncbi:sterol carrier protein domain-containing protein [Streptomyces prunicolor]|uniref:Sterol carrier protein domain-containing protein n=1 Tax=Streptomyces prunicolor TaxID=67348 RepID=A0ABU4F6Z5_9ACTN|nr:sterol carrier protein domain-containing protein [Streptomyces prunicolor]MCX5241178.1 sterol carrier protein domain-containing protein [Streptomyces prunicolor]MDV7216359.1 sterol carrier protein domain-containing protein [Streptomyces prunicolor]